MATLAICCCMCASTASTIQSVSRIPAARLARTQRPFVAAGTRRWISDSGFIFQLVAQLLAALLHEVLQVAVQGVAVAVGFSLILGNQFSNAFVGCVSFNV